MIAGAILLTICLLLPGVVSETDKSNVVSEHLITMDTGQDIRLRAWEIGIITDRRTGPSNFLAGLYALNMMVMGPYRLVVEKLTTCEDEGTREVVFGTRITRTSDGKYMYDNPVYFGHPIDQNYKEYIELQSFSNGGYRPRFIQYTFKGCREIWKYFQHLYKNLMRSAGGTIDGCPFPAGNYTTKDFDINFEIISNLPVMIYNKYKIVIIHFYNDKKVGCINVYADFIPK